MVNFGSDYDRAAVGGTPKKVRTLDEWASPKKKEQDAGKDASDEPMAQATGEEETSKPVAKPKPEAKAKPEPKAKPEAKPKPEAKAAAEPAVDAHGETAKASESEPSTTATTELCADVAGKGVCLEAAAGSLWMSLKSPSSDGSGKKVSPLCVLWHTREGKLKGAPVLKEGMFPYKLTMMDFVCFSKKGEIHVPKKLGDW